MLIPHRVFSFPCRLVVILLLALWLGGCSKAAHPSLEGTWVGEDAEGSRQTLIFRDDNTATWKIESSQFTGSFDIDYTFDASTTPYHLDLTGFDTGPLTGRTLYGIIAFDGDESFRLDVEPGEVNGNGEEARPLTFSDQTVVYTKTE
ncbi:MAG TPA: hypothetical protein VKP65_24140 [Rhodothermales bacterium]|nr:hypothetical protein [Rhodothermales bacterium]